MSKVFAVYFAIAGFTLVTVISIVNNAGLFGSLKRGLVVLAVCWVLGSFCGWIYELIVTDNSDRKNQEKEG